MKYKILRVIFIIFIFNTLDAKQGILVVPVADMIYPSAKTVFPKKSVFNFYKSIPFAPFDSKDGTYSCFRLHQALFNEIVEIVSEAENEICIKVSNCFFKNSSDNYNSTFWTLKTNIMPVDNLKKKAINLSHIPNPINYKNPQGSIQKIISLIFPFHDQKTNLTFSVGTRFVYESKNNSTYAAYIFDPKLMLIRKSEIPTNICFDNQEKLSEEQRINKFINILKRWAHLKSGFIPYVWGGCSFCFAAKDKFELVEQKEKKELKRFYDYPSYKKITKTGMDCSGMILRATQICGIPYYFKNTLTAEQNLESLNENDSISNGDIIWFSGHVIIVSDVKKNLCIEARHYDHGFGKIHEIHIKKLFKNIDNFDKLLEAFKNKASLERLNKENKVAQIIPKFKILKLKSTWKWKYNGK